MFISILTNKQTNRKGRFEIIASGLEKFIIIIEAQAINFINKITIIHSLINV